LGKCASRAPQARWGLDTTASIGRHPSADLVFACIGPALEIYSRYSKVVDAEEREIPLGGDPEASEPHRRGFLAYVWEVVGRIALEQVLGTSESKARNGAGGALEEDARLTALFLLDSSKYQWKWDKRRGRRCGDEDTDDEEEEAPKRRSKVISLIFDVARRFAQPLWYPPSRMGGPDY